MTRPDRLAAQLKTASTSQSEEIKEISNLLKSLNKTLNELSKKHTEAGRTLEELHRKNEEVRTTLGEIKQDNADYPLADADASLMSYQEADNSD
ncbi:hypothetical protein ACHWQZ_G017427 [Mnemiopsis leidyi]